MTKETKWVHNGIYIIKNITKKLLIDDKYCKKHKLDKRGKCNAFVEEVIKSGKWDYVSSPYTGGYNNSYLFFNTTDKLRRVKNSPKGREICGFPHLLKVDAANSFILISCEND